MFLKNYQAKREVVHVQTPTALTSESVFFWGVGDKSHHCLACFHKVLYTVIYARPFILADEAERPKSKEPGKEIILKVRCLPASNSLYFFQQNSKDICPEELPQTTIEY